MVYFFGTWHFLHVDLYAICNIRLIIYMVPTTQYSKFYHMLTKISLKIEQKASRLFYRINVANHAEVTV